MGRPRPWYAVKRWMYRGNRPRRWARAVNAVYGWAFAGRWLRYRPAATLEVIGRRTGAAITLPVAIADLGAERFLVSMLGESSWVLNVRAADGRAVILQRGARTPVRLHEIDVAERPQVLRRYLELAPGARPHVPVPWKAPVAEFATVAADFPVFRIEPENADK